MSAHTPRVVIVTRPTELERVLARHGTYAQAAFAMRTWGQDIEVVRARHERFEAALAEARARLEGAQAIHEKSEQLFKREHLPRQELIAATSALRAAEAQVKQAELRLERSVIEAPIARSSTAWRQASSASSLPSLRKTLVHFSHRVPPVQNMATFLCFCGSRFSFMNSGNSVNDSVSGSMAPLKVPIAIS